MAFASRLFRLPLLLLVLGLTPTAHAQTRRVVYDLTLVPELQAELALKNGSYLLLAVQGQIVPAALRSSFYNPNPPLFSDKAVGAAYEHFWNDHWSGGATLQYAPDGYVAPELLVRHRSPLGPLTFGQRLGLFRIFPSSSNFASTLDAAQNWLTFRADLEKLLPVGTGVLLRPRLSYEAATHLRLQKGTYDPDERTIQFTSLRGEVGVRLNDHFDFTPWVAYTTNYLFTIGQYNPIGLPIGGGRLNQVTPFVGVEARLTLFAGKAVFERRQLPTQH